MSSHLPEKQTYVVCTNQLGAGHRKLLSDKQKRKVSVFYQKEFALLTTADKKLDHDFTCKSSWSKGLSGGAFGVGAGVGVGTGIAASATTIGALFSSAAVASAVPVIGWVVGGTLALTAIGFAIYNIFTAPKCTGALGHISSQWKLYHPTVYYNKHNALLSRSILQCGEGGVLLPFLSINVAYKTSEFIARNNKLDIGLGVVVSGLGGFGIARLLIGGNSSAIGISLLLGNYIIPPSAEYVGDAYVDIYRDKRYSDIEEAIGEKKEEDKTYMDYIMASANPIDDTQTVIKNADQIITNMKANGASKEAIADFERAIAEAKKAKTFGNKETTKVLKDIQDGKYGKEAKDIFTNKSGNTIGKNRGVNYDKAIKAEQDKIALNKTKSFKSMGDGGMTLLGLAQPFLSAIFNKRALLLAKEAQEKEQEKDETNAISVVSTNY